MEEKFARIKTALEKTSFQQLEFSINIKNSVQQQIRIDREKEDLYLAVLRVLMKERTGYELAQLLRSRGMDIIQGNEGTLYSVLHTLEKERLLVSNWDEEGAKYYQISNKGRKVLKKLEAQQQESNKVSLRKLVEG